MKLAFKLFSLLVLPLSASAQTPAAPPSKTATHHAAGSAPADKPVSALPKVAGLPHTLYTLKYVEIKIGTGELPPPMRYYTVNYTGYLPDGTKFDSTIDPAFKHPNPFTFPYGGHRVITGWDTGFEGMRIGGKRRLFVPYQLGYGLAGSPPKIPAKTNLIFDVELVSISDKPPAPPANPAPRPTPPGGKPATPPVPSTGAPATPPPASSPSSQPPASAPAAAPPAVAPPPAPTPAPAKPVTPPTK